MTAPDLFTYEGHGVRVITDGGEPWFVAVDVCAVIGVVNTSDAVRSLDDDEYRTVSAALVTTEGRPQDMLNVVSESGLYSLVLRSRKPEARAFKRWVTHDVLPAIRKTGSYAVAQPPAVDVSALDRRALALMVIEAEDARAEAEAARAVAEQRAAQLEPSALAWDHLATAEGDYQVADAAKILTRAGIKTGRDRLFTTMSHLGWVYRARSDNRWRTYQTAIERGWLSELPSSHYHPRTGELILDPPQVRVTVKGLAELRQRLAPPGTDLIPA